MGNYVSFGPVSLRISRKHLAAWGWPLARIWGVSLFCRDSGGGLTFVSYHPVKSGTWYWSFSWQPFRADEARHWFRWSPDTSARGQKHHRLDLFRRGSLMLSTQDYHKRPRHGHKIASK